MTLGDSAISGEAGRWAGNTNGDPARADALGPTAYWDTASGSVGGCGVCNRDADWANDTVVDALNSTTRNAAATSGLANVKVLDMQTALNGRRLCENTVGLLEEQGVAAWTSADAVDKTEWVAQIRTATTVFGHYQVQEASHASYWGQLAMRNCLRQAYNGGAVRGGACVGAASGLMGRGEPQMALQ